ncbi:TPA: ABC transporter ATP-binding protein, partial [Candidatus Bathyarchaeota archaeon]|nr:ABC transporter ATP-binding protein [Candidatus Bathyarchaeota archaeon]
MRLVIEGVVCGYGSREALRDVTLAVGRGEVLGVLGPNGSGKTTLLRVISRALKPWVGAILLDGREVYSMGEEELAREMACIPQESTLPFGFKALEVVLMGRNPHLGRFRWESKKDFEVAKKAMEEVGAWHLADRRFNELSGGEKQKVIIARALCQQPRVLLMDEPTKHLDVSSQIEVMELVRKLCKREGLTAVMVLHDFNMASRYCDRLLLLDRGRIAAAGTPEEVLTEENLRKVFKVRFLVEKHPVANSIYVIPIPERKPQGEGGLAVHVVCGGGSGSLMMGLLAKAGFKVTVGVVSALDSDFNVAKALRMDAVLEDPFSKISEKKFRENLSKILSSDAVVVTDFPVGFGNLRNLESALEGLKEGKPV